MPQFPEETVVLLPSRKVAACRLLASSTLLAVALLVPSLRGCPASAAAASAAGLAFLVGIARVLPGRCDLRLDDEGFTTSDLLVRVRYRWADVVGPFRLACLPFGLVVFDLEPRLARIPALAGTSRALSGLTHYLPDNYGMSAAGLVALMEERRLRASLSPDLSASALPGT
jgi:hypothetical protein